MTELVKFCPMLPPGSPAERGPGWTMITARALPSENLLKPVSDDVKVINECWQADIYHLRGLDLRYGTADHEPGQGYPVILDIGANIGAFSALALQMYPDCHVVALEPEPENFDLLTVNTLPFGERCQRVRAAVGAHEGSTVLFGSHGTGYTTHDADSDNGGLPVEQVTLERLITGPVALLKIDAEGAEYSIVNACPSEKLALVDRLAIEWHGTNLAPHVDDPPRRYGELLTKLAWTHSVTGTFGTPDEGGMVFGHSYGI